MIQYRVSVHVHASLVVAASCSAGRNNSYDMRVSWCSKSSRVRGPRCARSRRAVAARCDKLDYKASGVDIEAGNDLVQRIKKLNPDIGGFNGMFPFGTHPTKYFTN